MIEVTLFFAVCLFIAGLIFWNKSWYTRWITFTNELSGVRTHVTPKTFVGSKLIGGACIVVSILLLLEAWYFYG